MNEQQTKGITRRQFAGLMGAAGSAWATRGGLRPNTAGAAEPRGADTKALRNPTPVPVVSVDLRSVYPDIPSDAPPFHRGENGEVVIDFGGTNMLATADAGRTWVRCTGPRRWPEGYFEPARIGDQLVAVSARGVRRSVDGGRTWGEAEAIPPATQTDRYPSLNGPYVFSILVTSAGRIVIPEDYLTGLEGPDPDVLFANSSADGGRTWQRSAVIEPPDPLPKKPEGFGEPAVVELPNGELWMVFRSIFGHLWQCVSSDGGLTWSSPSSTGLASPASNVKAVRIPGTDAVVLSWNLSKPGPLRQFVALDSIYGRRAPLVFSVSHDSCRTWSVPTVAYAGAASYPQIHFTEKEMYMLFGSHPDPDVAFGAQPGERGLTLLVYDKQQVLALLAWTMETIRPYIDAGLVAHWLAP